MERGLLSGDVVSEHDLHSFACKLLSKTCDFLDVPPVHLRGVHKTGLPVPLDLEGYGFAARGLLRPTVNHFKKRSAVYDARCSCLATAPCTCGTPRDSARAIARQAGEQCNWGWGKF